jgi:ABC-2 type transport system ATP-binding protein
MIEATLKPDVEDYSSLPTELVAARFALTLFREEEVNLETAFLQLTQGLVQ